MIDDEETTEGMLLICGSGEEMEKDFESKLQLQSNENSNENNNNSGPNGIPRSRSINFRAPQEQFSIQDFDLGKIYGVGSYSKVTKFFPSISFPFEFIQQLWIWVLIKSRFWTLYRLKSKSLCCIGPELIIGLFNRIVNFQGTKKLDYLISD